MPPTSLATLLPSLISATTTFAPAFANLIAVAFHIPAAAPVMTATLFVSENTSSSIFDKYIGCIFILVCDLPGMLLDIFCSIHLFLEAPLQF